MTTWFTSDPHFGHENIIEYCLRPFKNAQKMDQCIIYNYRKVIRPEDTLIIVGDFTIKGSTYKGYLEHISSQIPGYKILVLGNHDKFDPFIYEEVGFKIITTAYVFDGFKIVHDPVKSITDHTCHWVTGHVHTQWKSLGNCYNVGVDQHGFFPVSLEELQRWRNENPIPEGTYAKVKAPRP